MADLERLKQALKNADAAGDAVAAKKIADAIRAQQGGSSAAPAAPAPGASTSPRFGGASVEEVQRRVDAAAAKTTAQLEAQQGKQRAAADVREFQNMPWWQKPLQATADVMTVMGNAPLAGYGEKAQARLKSLVGPESYDEELAASRRQTEAARNRIGNPGTALAAEVAANWKALPMRTLEGANAVKRIGLNALEGAGYGVAAAGGNDQNLAEGAGIGALLGAGGSTAAEIGSGATALISRAWQNYRANPDERALQALYDAGKAAKLNREGLEAFVKQHGPEARAIHALDRFGSDLGRDAANRNPAARETLETGLKDIESGQNERIINTIDVQAGRGKGGREGQTLDELKQATLDVRKPAINQAYEAARKAGADLPGEPFEALMSSKLGQDAAKKAEIQLRNRMAAGGQKVDDKTPLNDMALLDEMKRVLDDQATELYRSGNKSAGKVAQDAAASLRSATDVAMQGPEYAKARALRQSAYKTEEAINTGAEAAKRNQKVNTAAKARQAETAEDKLAQRQAYAIQQREQLQNNPNTAAPLTSMSTPAGQEAVQAVFDKRAPAINQRLDTEKMLNRVKKDTLGGSTTARQLLTAAGGGALGGLTSYMAGADPLTVGVTTLGGAGIGGTKVGPEIVKVLQHRMQTKQAAASPMIAELLMKSPTELPMSAALPAPLTLSPQDRNTLSRVLIQSQLPMQGWQGR